MVPTPEPITLIAMSAAIASLFFGAIVISMLHDRRRAKAAAPDFVGGFFHTGLNEKSAEAGERLRESLVLMARREAPAARKDGRLAQAEQDVAEQLRVVRRRDAAKQLDRRVQIDGASEQRLAHGVYFYTYVLSEATAAHSLFGLAN